MCGALRKDCAALSLLMGAVLLSSSALAATYYVARSACDDRNPGTSPNAPWCSIAHVMSIQALLRPDDNVLFHCLDVWNEELDLANVNGASGHPVTFGHYGVCALPNQGYAAKLPVIDGGSLRQEGIFANQSGVSYVTVDGFDIHDTTLGGIIFNARCGNMPGILIEHSMVHHTGAGAYTGATEGPSNVFTGPSSGLCTSAPDAAGPCDPNRYDYDAGIAFNEFCSSGDAGDGVHLIGNTVFDLGGHNSIRVHYDRSPNVLVQGNLAGPGCTHNCFDIKGFNGFVRDNIAVCQSPAPSVDGSPSWIQPRGAQCDFPVQAAHGIFNIGFDSYTEFGGDTTQSFVHNVAHDVGVCFQTSAPRSHPQIYNNTCYNATYIQLYLQTCTSADVEKNLFSAIGSHRVFTAGVGEWAYNDNFGVSNPPSGNGNIDVDPEYADPAHYNYAPRNPMVSYNWSDITVTPDDYLGAVAPPIIVAPDGNSSVTGPVEIQTQRGTGVKWLNVYIDGTHLASSPPFNFSWDSSKFADGEHKISAVAYGYDDQELNSDQVTINVTNPAVKIDQPATGSAVSGIVTIGTERRQEVEWINVYIDGKHLASSPPFSFKWDSTTVPNGRHSISAKGYRDAGTLLGSASVTVQVNN